MIDNVKALAELRIIWIALVVAIPVVPAAAVFALRHEPAPTPPEWVDALLWAGVLSSLAAWPAITRFRRIVEKMPRTAADLLELRQGLILGVALADLPMIFGIVHYVLSADLRVVTGLTLLSLLIAFAFRPPAD